MIMVNTPSLRAAEKVPWDKLIGLAEDGTIDAITHDGRKHHARTLWLDPGSAELTDPDGNKVVLSRNDVKRIEVRMGRPRKHYLHHIAESAKFPVYLAELGLGSDEALALPLFVPWVTIAVPTWAYTVASAPFFLAAEGISLLASHTYAFEIVP